MKRHFFFYLTIFCFCAVLLSIVILQMFFPRDNVLNRKTGQVAAFVLRSTPVPTGIAEFRTVGVITEVFPSHDNQTCAIEVNAVKILLDGVSNDESTASANVGKLEGIDCVSPDFQKIKGRYIEAVLREVKESDGSKYYSLHGDAKYYVKLMPNTAAAL